MSKKTKPETRADRIRRYTGNAVQAMLGYLAVGSVPVGAGGHNIRITKFEEAKKVKLQKMNAQYGFMAKAGAERTELEIWQEVRTRVTKFATRKTAEAFLRGLR